MKIVLLGYMGAGKSTLASRIAKEWGLPLLDLDTELENQQGVTIAQLMQQSGEIYFRKLERQMLEQLLPGKHYVLATGGGTPCYYDNMALINSYATSIYLSASVSLLAQRLEPQRHSRPLLSHLEADELSEFIAKHLFERAPFYREAKLTIPSRLTTESEQLEFLNDNL